MDKEDLAFTLVFVFSLAGLFLFLGNSITGNVIQTMHCEDGVCKEFCNSNTDCPGDICCEMGGFGICEDESVCEQEYKFAPKTESGIDIDKMPILESPAATNNSYDIIAYSGVILVVIALGLLYYVKKKH